MKTYEIKLRVFPHPLELYDWDTEALDEWEWEIAGAYTTSYARPITDGTREGLSIKLIVSLDDDSTEPPEEWDWPSICQLEAARVEFVRAKAIAQPVVAVWCYHCDKLILAEHAWKDDEGDRYCSSKCVEEQMGEEAFRVGPDGREYGERSDEEE